MVEPESEERKSLVGRWDENISFHSSTYYPSICDLKRFNLETGMVNGRRTGTDQLN